VFSLRDARAARRKLSPEFLNRIDKVVTFKPLGAAALNSILDIELAAVQKRVVLGSRFKPFTFELTNEARIFLIVDEYDPRYGARHLKRSIEKHISQKFAKLLASKQVRAGDHIEVDAGDGELKVQAASANG
jgi:ATP-dependent Clp protease ATP-binding subunit ClpA